MTDFIYNERNVTETILTMPLGRPQVALALLAATDPDEERTEERAALAAEVERRADYSAAQRVELEAMAYRVVQSGPKWRAYRDVEGLTLPGVGNADNEDQAWAALVWAVRRDPLTRRA